MTRQDALEGATERLAQGAARWEDAYQGWVAAGEVRDQVMARMERKLLAATGGLSVARFKAVCRRRSVRSVAEAQQKAAAIRSRPGVESAMVERDQAVAAADATVASARTVLAEASKVVLGYGEAGPRLVGRNRLELRRLARLPARTINN